MIAINARNNDNGGGLTQIKQIICRIIFISFYVLNRVPHLFLLQLAIKLKNWFISQQIYVSFVYVRFLQQSIFDVLWQLLENCKLSQVLGTNPLMSNTKNYDVEIFWERFLTAGSEGFRRKSPSRVVGLFQQEGAQLLQVGSRYKVVGLQPQRLQITLLGLHQFPVNVQHGA